MLKRIERFPAIQRRRLNSRWAPVLLGWALALLCCTAAAPGRAAPPGPSGALVSWLAADLHLVHLSAFVLLLQAEQSVQSVLSLFTEDDLLPGAAVGGAEMQLLRPGVRIVLQTSWETLGFIADGLAQLNLVLAEDVLEELTVSPALLAQLAVDADRGILTVQEAGAAQERVRAALLAIAENLDGVEINVALAGGQCGDFDALVRVLQATVGRALGLGNRLDEPSSVDPAVRRLALVALRVHFRQLQTARHCLAQFI